MRTVIRSTWAAAVAMLVLVTGCSSGPAPKSSEAQRSLMAEADATVAAMTAKDPSLRSLLDRVPGYAVFPNVGKGGLVVGGAYGRGVVYQNGRPIGYAELKQASVGAQIGGASYGEILVFENEAALNRFKAGDFDLGAEISAVAISAGAAGAAQFEDGYAVFQMPKGGLMAAAAVNGQKFNFEPLDRATTAGSGSTTRSTTRSSGEMELRSDRPSDRIEDTSDRAQRASDRTERRIEERLDRAQDRANEQAEQR
jgi:lipid-binding SYLF domain-containing protein